LDDCHPIFLQNGNTARFSLYTESRNISLKSVFDFFITLERRRQGKINLKHFRNNKICCFLTICKSRSGFGRIFCTVFETVCVSSLAICADQKGEHLHLTFSGHLDKYSQQANPNFRFPTEQIPLVFWIMFWVGNKTIAKATFFCF
jgi:hypothetical protein